MELKTKQKKCIHHWIIDSPDNVTSSGKCIHCGTVKEFINDWETAMIASGKTPDGYKAQHQLEYLLNHQQQWDI